MSMEGNVSLNEKLKRLNDESSDKLQNVLLNYDEIYTLLKTAGYDTTELQKIIKSALQDSLVLMSVIDDNVNKFISDHKAVEF